MKSLALLLFSILLNISAFAQNGVYLFGYMENAPGTTFDISVVIYSSPPVTAQFTVNPDGNITNNQNYWVDLPSADWTHFEVLYPTCNNETNILTVLADSLPNMIDVFYEIDYCPGGNEVYGCTNPNAINYDPNATLDDGTCFYDENTGCVDVNLDVFCVDTLSNAYDITIADDPFCCETSWDQLCQQNYEAFGGQPLPECDEGEEDILGCTDPNALNYNSNATVDDGSCTYNDSCLATTAEILIITDQWGQEVSWSLYYEGVEIAGDGGYQGNSTYSYPLCLEDGCYTFEMYDSFGDGWNGATFSVLANGGVVAYGTLNTGDFGFVDFGINTTGCDSSNYVIGCTDPNAINYDPNATLDDGSCEYESDVENDLCADATWLQPGTQLITNVGAVNNENIWGECWAFGNGEGEQSSIWYSFTTPDEPATIHIEASPDGTNTLTDTQFGLFEECGGEMIYCDGNAGQGLFSAFHFDCGELEENTTYTLMIDGYFGDMGTCYLTYDVSTNCEVLGCTDPDAINYDPSATIDDGSCEYETECTSVTLVLDGPSINQGFFDLFSDNGFALNGTYGGSDQTYEWCLEDGCYEMFFVMNNGDSIPEDVVYTIFMEDSIIDGGTFMNQTSLVSFGVNASCDSADVYGCTDPEALNYDPNATVNDGSCEYECGELSFEFVPFGNPPLGCVGQMVATYTGADQNGTLVWDYGAGTPPLTSNDMTGFYQYSENGEYLVCTTYYTANCTLQYCDTLVTYGCNEEVYGCTNPQAINYDPNATIDDGSCQYDEDCVEIGDEYCVDVTSEAYEITILQDAFCCNSMWDQICQNAYIELGGPVGEDCDIYGCTDPEAINYSPNATMDDGSCEYDGCQHTLYLTLTGGENLPDSASIYWTLFVNNQAPAGIGPHYPGDEPHEICATDGCYILYFGPIPDGWEGDYTLSMNGVVLASGPIMDDNGYMSMDVYSELLGCEEEEIDGCTDPLAINYNPDATVDDGSCEYEEDCTDVTISFSSAGAVQGFFDIYSQNDYVIGGFYPGGSFSLTTCLEDGCYDMLLSMGAGGLIDTVAYSINIADSVVANGIVTQPTTQVSFGVNTDCDDAVFGCTDPLAINYNPNATVDDGSCEYDEGCVEVGDEYCVDTDSQAYYITVTQDSFCCNTQWDQICQNAYIEFGGPIGDDCEIYGCTDPGADNYNPAATIDDGSCEYEFECAISFTVSPDTTGAQVIWITPSINIYNAVSVEWDFGDGNTSNDLFPIHTYDGDGPYMLCLTATFEDNGGFCEITYCAELTDEMINPPGMQSEGFSINVVDALGTTGVEETEWISELSLWPNPATDVVQVQFALHENTDVNLELYDAIGKMVYHSNAPSHWGKNLTSIDVADLEPGMYFLRLNGNNEQMTTRLVVQ